METNQKPLLENLKKPAKGLQPFVDPAKDLLWKKDLGGNSWFVIGHFETQGHKLSFMFHLSLLSLSPKIPMFMANSVFSITDETTGWYCGEDKMFTSLQAKVSEKEFRIQVPNGSMSGDLDQLHVQATLPNGKVDVTMRAVGHVLYNGGAGYIRMFDVCAYQYSIPTLVTTGTITIEGKTYDVNGTSWFDRQFAGIPKGKKIEMGFDCHWIWMDLNFLDNEDKISLWDMIDNATGEEYAWATILHPDGSQTVIAVEPLSEGASDYWRSPKSGQNYPTHWTVKIPSLDACLEVTPSPREQEIVSKQKVGCKYEGASSFKGTYQGKETIGYCYVELVGPWD